MSQQTTFIPSDHRPTIKGGRLDPTHVSFLLLEADEQRYGEDLKPSTIVFGPKQDPVLLHLEHAISISDNILVLYYEDLHRRWSFFQDQNESYFLVKLNEAYTYRVFPQQVYIRGCQVEMHEPAWQEIGEFYTFIDNWPGKILCSPKKQQRNESKLYQLSTTLKKASQEIPQISIGKSYVIKGSQRFKQLPKAQSYIVKSLSGVRSIVVDESTYMAWSQNGLNHLPVLFQEKIEGNDVRIHTLKGNLYGKRSEKKESIDYRYDEHFFTLSDINNIPDYLKNFCVTLTELEQNGFLGIDFIVNHDKYVALEANPSPGWSAYYPCNGIDKPVFVNDLLNELKHV